MKKLFSENKGVILGFVVLALLAAVPVYYGSLVVPTGGTITNPNFSSGQCIQTTTGGLLATTGFSCGTTGTAYTFTSPLLNTAGTITCSTCFTTAGGTVLGSVTIAPVSGNPKLSVNAPSGQFADLVANSAATTSSQASYNDLINNDTSPTSLEQIGNWRAIVPGLSPNDEYVYQMEAGTAGAVSGNYGGFVAFHTKADGGGDAEAEVLTPDHKAYFPNNETILTVSDTGVCTAFVICGTITWTFNLPYATTSGAAALPVCSGTTVMDDSSTSTAWIAVLKTPLTSSAVTYSYMPFQNVASGDTLSIYATCWVQGY